MVMSITTNLAEFSALAAARASEMMDTAMIGLSSGKRINSATMMPLELVAEEWKLKSTA